MADFIDAALTFPAALFSFLLIVVAGYWLLVMVGGADPDDLDTGSDSDGTGFAGFLAGIGLGGVPVTVVLSLLIALAWFLSLVGAVLLDTDGAVSWLAAAALLGALAGSWLVTRLLVVLLRRAMPAGAEPSRADFVGRTCIIRTGRVDRRFGQAEVTAADGSSAVVQVRQTGEEPLRAGSTAVIYSFDADGEFFWVVPLDVALHPEPGNS